MNEGNTPNHIRVGMLALLATKMWVPVCQEAGGGGHRTILYASGAFAAWCWLLTIDKVGLQCAWPFEIRDLSQNRLAFASCSMTTTFLRDSVW